MNGQHLSARGSGAVVVVVTAHSCAVRDSLSSIHLQRAPAVSTPPPLTLSVSLNI
jgi:hypothetical protein